MTDNNTNEEIMMENAKDVTPAEPDEVLATEADRGKGRSWILPLATLICMLALVVLGCLVFYWSSEGATLRIGEEVREQEMHQVIRTIVICTAMFIVSVVLALLLKKKTLIAASPVLYIIGITLGIVLSQKKWSYHWAYIGGNYAVYYPVFILLTIPFIAYLVSRYRRFGALYTCAFALVCAGPLAVLLYFIRDTSLWLALSLTFFVLVIKLAIDKRLRYGKQTVLLVVLLMVLLALYFFAFNMNKIFSRIEIMLSRGLTDPNGNGWLISQLDIALGQSHFAGPSDYYLDIVSPLGAASIPAYEYFADFGLVCAPAVFILKWGWISVAPILALVLAPPVLLFKMSSRVKNSFSKYFAFIVAVLFLVRTVIGILSCFVAYLEWSFLPFFGNRFAMAADIALCTAAVISCVKKENSAKGLIDKSEESLAGKFAFFREEEQDER